jgi:hypothetical protein
MRSRILTLLPLSALLSACWQSDSPLISDAEADGADIAGSFSYSDSNGAGHPVTVTKERGGYYRYVSTDSDGQPMNYRLRLDRLSSDWYIVQAQSIDAGGSVATPNYEILRVLPGAVEEYTAECREDEIQIGGVSIEDGDCTFDTYAALQAIAASHVEEFVGGDDSSLTLSARYER